MTVTDIVEVNKKKSKVYLDSEFAFVLYKGELHSYHIEKGAELPYGDYQTIMEELLPKRAVKRAMNLLKERSYTKMQLVRKLKENFYCDAHIDAALSYVESYGYLDDFRYATDFITYRASMLSRRQIEQKLMQKGIDGKVIAQALEAFYEEGNEIEEEMQILNFLQKKNFPSMADERQKQKLIASLLRKGFSLENIRSVAKKMELDLLDETISDVR